jgi:hypothetical protein
MQTYCRAMHWIVTSIRTMTQELDTSSAGQRACSAEMHGQVLCAMLDHVSCKAQVSITKRTEPSTSTALFSGFVFPQGGKLLEVSPRLLCIRPGAVHKPMPLLGHTAYMTGCAPPEPLRNVHGAPGSAGTIPPASPH